MQNTTVTTNATTNATTVTTTTTLRNLKTQKAYSATATKIQVAQQNAKNAVLYTVAQKQLALQLQALATSTFCLQNAQTQQVYINLRKKFICVKVNNAVALMQQNATAFAKLVNFCNANNVTVLTTVNNALLMRIAQTA